MDCSLPCSSLCNSLGKNTRVDCHALLQGIFLTQWSNLHLCVSCIVGRFTSWAVVVSIVVLQPGQFSPPPPTLTTGNIWQCLETLTVPTPERGATVFCGQMPNTQTSRNAQNVAPPSPFIPTTKNYRIIQTKLSSVEAKKTLLENLKSI